MAEERVQRRLAAILAADVVGYIRLMGTDEAGTLEGHPLGTMPSSTHWCRTQSTIPCSRSPSPELPPTSPMHPGAPAGSRYRGTIVADFHLPGHGDGCIDATAVGHRAVGAWASARSPDIAHADHEAHDVVAEALHEGARPALAGAVASAARSTTRRQAALAFVAYQAHRIGAEVIHRCAIGGIIRKSSPTQIPRGNPREGGLTCGCYLNSGSTRC